MARNVAVSVENNFSKGLITEASGMNFPENACSDTYNCVFDRVGAVTRRPGFDFERLYETKTINRTGGVVNSYLWRNASGSGDDSLVVVQVGSKLYFYNLEASNGALSSGKMTPTIDLTTFAPVGAPDPATNECQYSAGFGRLFVTHPNLESFAVAYDRALGTFSTTQIDIKIRDFVGVDDGLTTDNRPGSLSDPHKYNLYNQGWRAGEITTWDGARTDFPSNSDIWWQYKDASEVFTPSLADKIYLGNTPAPKGHYILNAYNQDRSTASGIAGFTPVTTGHQRCSTSAFFAGRVFYSGLDYIGNTSKVFFSQIIESPSQFGLCYQSSDPTSEELFDLLPSDGGVIDIAGAGTVLKLFPLQDALIVFATNGVWSITGSQGLGFTANDYSVNNLSSVTAISASSFVNVGGYPLWWNASGIYGISPEQTSGAPTVNSLTDATIKSFFDTIPLNSKKQARGFYNLQSKVVQWMFRSTEASTIEQTYEFDGILNLSTLTGAFYPWVLSDSSVRLNAMVVVNGSGAQVTTENVVRGGDNVVDGSGNQVIRYLLNASAVLPDFKYLVSYSSGGSYAFTWADCADEESFVDWYSYDSVGVNYVSYLVSGYRIRGDAQRKFQANYLYVFSTNDEPSQLTVQGIWNFSKDTSSGKHTSVQNINFDGEDFSVYYRRLKIRGTGLAVQFKFSSVTGQPFKLLGWSVLESGNAGP